MFHTPRMTHLERHEPGPHTWADFVALPEDDRRELIDGELLEVEVPTTAHERIAALLVFFLETWSRAGGGGMTLVSGYKVRVSDTRGVMPDVQFYRAGNIPRGQPQGLAHGHPDLVVEVLSPSSARFDRVLKMTYYAAIGVPEYWIVDPAARTLERLVLTEGHYTIADALEGDALFQPPSFEGMGVALEELWAAVDALAAES